MPLNANELARRSAGAIEMRTDPLRLRLRMADLATADAHRVDIAFSCSAAALDRRGEREMFAEVFLVNRDVATIDDLAAHFSATLKHAAATVVATAPAEHWLADANQGMLIDALRQSGGRAAFACGVELLAPFEVVVTSPSLARENLEASGRKLSERRTAGQVEHVQRSAELLKQFEALRQAMPALSPGKLLERFGESDRGSMLQSLLMTSTGSAAAQLWTVAGSNLVRIDPRQSPLRPALIELPGDLGPLRSVQPDERRLLIGAQSGVMVVDPDRPGGATRLRDPQTASQRALQLGFNSVAATGSLIWASHGESGVLAWRTSEPDAPAKAIRGANGARNLIALDDARVVFSLAGNVMRASLDDEPATISAANATVVLIGVERDRLLVIRSDGTIEQLDREDFERIELQRRCGEITSAAILPWLGSSRILMATADGPVCCVGLDDGVVTQYLSAHKGLRAMAACADAIGAVSADRQRLLLWNTWGGERPAAELHVGSIARHRAADICFG